MAPAGRSLGAMTGVGSQTATNERGKRMADTEDIGGETVVTFLQALANTIWELDRIPPEDRTRKNFTRAFDGYLDILVGMAEKDGSDIRKNVQFLRKALDRGFEHLARMGKTNGGLSTSDS